MENKENSNLKDTASHESKKIDELSFPDGWGLSPETPDVASNNLKITIINRGKSELPDLYNSRLFASLLVRYAPSDPERAHVLPSTGEGITFALFGEQWSLEIRSITHHDRPDDPPLVYRLAQDQEGRLTEHPLLVSWYQQVEQHDSSPALTLRWKKACNLLERAQRSGSAICPGNARIEATAFLHPTVEVSGPVEVGAQTKIWHFSKLLGPLKIGERCSFGQNVVIERGVEIGNNVKVQNNVSIYAGVILEDDVFCGPSMVFTNVGTPRSHYPRRHAYSETRVGRGASIGANATIVCGNQLGRYCFVGAGSVVTRDVPDYALVYGNPARIRGWACYCGVKLTFAPLKDQHDVEHAHCEECGRYYERHGERVRQLDEA